MSTGHQSELPGPLSPPDGAPERLTKRSFPPYAYVPRVEPHPITHPEGHSYGVREEALHLGDRRLPRDWSLVEEYLYGADLFNAGYFWEAHESWEAVWHAVDRESVVASFLQGLIQASASLLQRHCGNQRGARNLLDRAEENLAAARDRLATGGVYMGLEVDPWLRELEQYHGEPGAPFPFLRLGS